MSVLQVGVASHRARREFERLTPCEWAGFWPRIKIGVDTLSLARRLHSSLHHERLATRPTAASDEWNGRTDNERE